MLSSEWRLWFLRCSHHSNCSPKPKERTSRGTSHPDCTVKVDGLSIFYAKPGRKTRQLFCCSTDYRPLPACLSRSSPGFPIATTLSRPTIPASAHSDAPAPKDFSYTFDNIANVMNHFTETLNLNKYTLYMQDYGGPVGFRMALAHPDRVEALIVQDAVAHNEGLGANWKTRRAFWADRATYESKLRTNLLSMDTTRTRHVGNDPASRKVRPDLWTDEYAFLNKPGEADIQSDLFYDYRTNVDAYPKWQAWMQKNPAASARALGKVRLVV